MEKLSVEQIAGFVQLETLVQAYVSAMTNGQTQYKESKLANPMSNLLYFVGTYLKLFTCLL